MKKGNAQTAAPGLSLSYLALRPGFLPTSDLYQSRFVVLPTPSSSNATAFSALGYPTFFGNGSFEPRISPSFGSGLRRSSSSASFSPPFLLLLPFQRHDHRTGGAKRQPETTGEQRPGCATSTTRPAKPQAVTRSQLRPQSFRQQQQNKHDPGTQTGYPHAQHLYVRENCPQIPTTGKAPPT